MAIYKNLAVIGPQWVKKETRLDAFTEQTIFDFLLTIFSRHNTTEFYVLLNIYYFPKRLNYQFLFSIQRPSHSNKIMQQILKKAYKLKNILNSVKYSPPHINIT